MVATATTAAPSPREASGRRLRARPGPAGETETADTTPPSGWRGITRRPWWPWLTRGAAAAFFALVAWLIVHQARTVDWPAVLEALQALPPGPLVAAGALALASHFTYGTFDWVGRHCSGHPLSRATTLRIAMTSYPFTLNLGSLIGGVGVRYRLYDRRGARWAGRYVHEHVEVQGGTGQLTAEIEHFPYRDVADHLETIDRYTTYAARQMYESGRRAGFLQQVGHPPLAFLRNYLLRGGIRDGMPGLIISAMNAYYVFLKFAKLWELTEASPQKDRVRASSTQVL